MSDDELLTVDEACALLKKSRAGFYAWRRRRGIPSRVDGRRLMFYKRDLVRGDSRASATVVDYAELARQHGRRRSDGSAVN